MNPEDKSDLLWDAFRYVADELADDERGAFEERLAEDQAAREAVAQAVQLSQAVASVSAETNSPAPPRRPNLSRSRRSAVVLSAAAALAVCLLLAVGILFNGADKRGKRPVTETTSAETDRAGALLALWSSSEAGSLAFPQDDAENENQEQETIDSQYLESFDDSLDDFTVPDWMVSAVRGDVQQDELPPEPEWEEL